MPVPVTLLPPPRRRSPPPLFEMAKKGQKKAQKRIDKKWFVALNVRGCGVKWWGQAVTASGGAFAGAAQPVQVPVVLKRVCGLTCRVRGQVAKHRERLTLRQRGKDVECSSGEIRTIEFLSECRCLIWFKNSRLGLLYEKVQGEPDPI